MVLVNSNNNQDVEAIRARNADLEQRNEVLEQHNIELQNTVNAMQAQVNRNLGAISDLSSSLKKLTDASKTAFTKLKCSVSHEQFKYCIDLGLINHVETIVMLSGLNAVLHDNDRQVFANSSLAGVAMMTISGFGAAILMNNFVIPKKIAEYFRGDADTKHAHQH